MIKLINNSGEQLHNSIIGLESKQFNGIVYNFGVKTSMSYFAENVLVSNCRCVALVIMDREKMMQLKKQPDGSYAIPAIKAA